MLSVLLEKSLFVLSVTEYEFSYTEQQALLPSVLPYIKVMTKSSTQGDIKYFTCGKKYSTRIRLVLQVS